MSPRFLPTPRTPAQRRALGLVSATELPSDISEKDFMSRVVAQAKTHGWMHYHTHRSDKSPAGFPDLALIHEKSLRLMFIELKRTGEKPTPPQKRWIAALTACGVTAFVAWPEDFGQVCERLMG